MRTNQSPAQQDLKRINQNKVMDASAAAPPNVLRASEEPAHPDLTQLQHRNAEAASTISSGRKTKKQRVDGMPLLDFLTSWFRFDHIPVVKKLNSLVKWLHAWNSKDTYERTILLRQPDTCIWLPNTNAYKTWRDTEDSFLWLHGKREVFDPF